MSEEPISWMTLGSGTRIAAADGTEVGRVHEVIADRQKDIFSGITFRDGILGGDRFIPAELIGAITADQVQLTVGTAEVEERTEPYEG